MTSTLVRQHPPHTGPVLRVDLGARARDWSEIQERMLVPLHEAVYERLDVGPATRLLGLGCGSGLALLTAASRGAAVTGVEAAFPERLALARERLLPRPWDPRTRTAARLLEAVPRVAEPYTLVTAFEPVGCLAGDGERLADALGAARAVVPRGTPVVLAGWGPPERCATGAVLRTARRATEPTDGGGWRPAHRDDLEEVAARVGLRPDGSGRVACPFGYADLASALRGLHCTGFLDTAVAAAGRERVDKELTEALHPYRRPDGTVWMPNVFRYLIARVH
ncbi:SAM-dependent methyltransferase [Streptomyces sp. NPDC093252]|uniref:SAM-dependent methyltransferase n=1 Tax=Streptomyces sp. NPDC093252 TaxID=3154980 RepID=UPI003414EBEE